MRKHLRRYLPLWVTWLYWCWVFKQRVPWSLRWVCIPWLHPLTDAEKAVGLALAEKHNLQTEDVTTYAKR